MIANEQSDRTHWYGNKNKIIRYFFYVQRGLALFNEFRYIIMAVFGIYFTLKLDNPLWLLLMFSIACPILIGVGWVSVHHVGKVVDWLNIRFATHYSLYQFTLLEDILKEMKKLNDSALPQSKASSGLPGQDIYKPTEPPLQPLET